MPTMRIPDEHSFRKLLPTFVISAGTQVVLKVAKCLADGVQFKPAGSVGIVLQSPPDNRQPYLVRFTDGDAIEASFDELALRRREVEDELGQIADDMRPWIIYRCQVGSRAFGLACEDSDDDLRGIFLPPARFQWSLRRLPEQLEFNTSGKGDGCNLPERPDGCCARIGPVPSSVRDEVYWEIEKFLRLALKANPNVLETLWTPLVLLADETAQELRAMRQAFLSKHVYKTYSGYVLSQFRRMANAHKSKGSYKSKHAMHLIRLLHSGIAALETGEIRIDVGEHRAELLQIRNDGLPFEEVKRRALQLDERFQRAFERTRLPEQPDYAEVDDLLIRARRRMIDA
jgi:predicted nucleotidyltransferase